MISWKDDLPSFNSYIRFTWFLEKMIYQVLKIIYDTLYHTMSTFDTPGKYAF